MIGNPLNASHKVDTINASRHSIVLQALLEYFLLILTTELCPKSIAGVWIWLGGHRSWGWIWRGNGRVKLSELCMYISLNETLVLIDCTYYIGWESISPRTSPANVFPIDTVANSLGMPRLMTQSSLIPSCFNAIEPKNPAAIDLQ